MQGQANHFYRCKKHDSRLTAYPDLNTNPPDAPTKISYAITRYQTETLRLYTVLNARLSSQRTLHKLPSSPSTKQPAYLIANKYTITDLCCFSWVNWAEWAGVPLTKEKFPELLLWLEAIQRRPAVERGVNVPEKFEMKEAMRTREGEEEYARHHSNWVMKGQEEERGKYQ